MERSGKHNCYCCLLLTGYLFGFLFDPENGGDRFLRNVRETYSITRRYISEYNILHTHSCVNLKSNVIWLRIQKTYSLMGPDLLLLKCGSTNTYRS
jgi:hypothetical protein